jgi:hypothetical protein
LRQLGQTQKLAQAQNRTTISKFSLAKSLKHTVVGIGNLDAVDEPLGTQNIEKKL